MCHGPTGFPLRRGKMLDSTEIKGAVRLKISHWPNYYFLLFFMLLATWSFFMVHIRFTPSEGPMNHEKYYFSN